VEGLRRIRNIVMIVGLRDYGLKLHVSVRVLTRTIIAVILDSRLFDVKKSTNKATVILDPIS